MREKLIAQAVSGSKKESSGVKMLLDFYYGFDDTIIELKMKGNTMNPKCVACGAEADTTNGYNQHLCEDCVYMNTCRREDAKGDYCGQIMYFLYKEEDKTVFRCSEHGEVTNHTIR